jgi:hypothetical protein
MARVWDVTWAAKLHGDALVRAVARTRLVGEGWLTEDELRTLRPLLGEVDPDMVARWLEPLPDRAEEAEMEAALARWHRHREMIRTLARKDWAAGTAQTNASLVKGGRSSRTSRVALALLPLIAIFGWIIVDQLANGLTQQLRRIISR